MVPRRTLADAAAPASTRAEPRPAALPCPDGVAGSVEPAAAACGPAVTGTGSSPISLTGLVAGTTYSLSLQAVCGGGGTTAAVTTTFTTLAPAPASLTVGNGQNLTATGAYANITVQSGGTLTLTGATSATGMVMLQTGGLLNTGCQVLSGSGSFTMQAGAELQICAADGISLSGATGAIQVTGTRSFASDASLHLQRHGGPGDGRGPAHHGAQPDGEQRRWPEPEHRPEPYAGAAPCKAAT